MLVSEERQNEIFHPLSWCKNEKAQRVAKIATSFVALNPEWNKYLQYASHPMSAINNLDKPLTAAYHAAVSIGMYTRPKLTNQVLQGAAVAKPIYTYLTDEKASLTKELFNLASTVTMVTASHYFQLEMKALTTAFQILCELHEAISTCNKDDKDTLSYLEILSNIVLAGIRFKLGRNDMLDAYYRHFGKEFTQADLEKYLNQKTIEDVFEENFGADTISEEIEKSSTEYAHALIEAKRKSELALAIRNTLKGVTSAFTRNNAEDYSIDGGLEDALLERFELAFEKGEWDVEEITQLLEEKIRFTGISRSEHNAQLEKGKRATVEMLMSLLTETHFRFYEVNSEAFANAFIEKAKANKNENPHLFRLRMQRLLRDKITFSFDEFDSDEDYEESDNTLPEIDFEPSKEEVAFTSKVQKLLSLRKGKAFQNVLTSARKAFMSQANTLPHFFMTDEQLGEENVGRDFASYLRENGFSNHIKDLYANWYIAGKVLRNIIFERCSFKATFEACVMNNTAFMDCHFHDTGFKASRLAAVLFANCKFQDSIFSKSELSDTLFENTTFTSSGIRDSVLNRVIFAFGTMDKPQFNNTAFRDVLFYRVRVIEGNFLHATVERVTAYFCNITDTVFGKAKKGIEFVNCQIKRIKPIIAYPTSTYSMAEWGSEPKECIRDCGGAAMPFEYLPYNIFGKEGYSSEVEEKLLLEVKKILQEHQDEIRGSSAMAVVFDHAKEGSQIAKVRDWVLEAMQEADGVALHGGDDVGEIFYSSSGDNNGDMLQDLVDGFSVVAAHRKNKAIMGICRGLQMVNVALGGTLRDVDKSTQGDQWIDMYLKIPEEVKERLPHLKNLSHLYAQSMHSQQCDQPAPGLEVLVERNGVPKIMMGKRTLLHQHHPEWYSETDEEKSVAVKKQVAANRGFYQRFVNMAKQSRQERA